jgi:hypothetical protein
LSPCMCLYTHSWYEFSSHMYSSTCRSCSSNARHHAYEFTAATAGSPSDTHPHLPSPALSLPLNPCVRPALDAPPRASTTEAMTPAPAHLCMPCPVKQHLAVVHQPVVFVVHPGCLLHVPHQGVWCHSPMRCTTGRASRCHNAPTLSHAPPPLTHNLPTLHAPPKQAPAHLCMPGPVEEHLAAVNQRWCLL